MSNNARKHSTGDWGLARYAHEYADKRGWPVVPWGPGTTNKKPGPVTRHSFKDATRDTSQIDRWWRKWPDAMINVPTGLAIKAFCVDLEHVSKGHGDGIANWEKLCAQNGGAP